MKITRLILAPCCAWGLGTASAADLLSTDLLVAGPVVMTSDTAGSHQVVSGNSFGVNTSGVGFIGGAGGGINCTGSLLGSGKHILTAAHCAGTGLQVTFDLPSGRITVPVSASAAHPGWDGQTLHGNDVAVLTLAAEVSSLVPRYDIQRGANALGLAGVFVGFGDSGLGTGGASLARGAQRTGLISYEANGLGELNSELAALITNNQTQLTADFDANSALVTNASLHDGFAVHFGRPSNLGFGADEIGFAPGDSGGPTFIGGQIAGVASYVVRLNGAAVSDVNGIYDYSWGEFSVSTRLADPSIYGFVDTVLAASAPIPEPSEGVLVCLGLVAMLSRRHRRSENPTIDL